MINLLFPSGEHAHVWIACFVSTIFACVLFWATDTSISLSSVLIVLCLVAVPISLHVIYTVLRPDPLIGPIAGSVAAVSWAGFVAGGTALAALRTHAPLVDASLAYADTILGVDTTAFVAWAAFHPWMGLLLDVAYLSTVPLLLVTLVFLGLTQRKTLMWELCSAFVGSATFCAFASAVIPAIGAFAYYRIPSGILSLLPVGAGLFHLSIFEGYRSGMLDTVDVRNLGGVVCFPSFHSAMAFMIAFALRGFSWLSVFSSVWCGLILISTIPIGGHYFVDLLAGLIVWATFTQLALTPSILFKVKTTISKPSKHIQVPAAVQDSRSDESFCN